MKLFIMFILLCTHLYAQEPSQLFIKFIPDKYHSAPEDIATFKTILNAIPEINLDLYYYFIESIKLDASNNSNAMFKKFINFMNSEKHHKSILFNGWKNDQINTIKRSNLEEDIKLNACRNFLISDPPENYSTLLLSPFPPDSNMINYYKMIYYSEQNMNNYDSTVNYTELISTFENKVIEEFKLVQKQINDRTYPETYKIPLFDKMVKYWYLFQSRISKEDSLHEYVVDYYARNYSVGDAFLNYEISLFYNSNALFDFKYSGDTQTPLIIPIKERINLNQVGFSFAYRFKLKEQKSIFSTINIGLSFAFGKVNYSRKLNDLDIGFFTIEKGIQRGQLYEVKFIDSKFSFKSIKYLDFSASVPIYYFLPDVLFSFGTNVYLNLVDYDLRYNYVSSITT
ncbi:MAG: hypothetical protein Q8S01_01010, partial [Ignavibacteria bacterium]|nr:hypothetical protein [Ignavibacteria bacterium]